jgi:hypothetical protein
MKSDILFFSRKCDSRDDPLEQDFIIKFAYGINPVVTVIFGIHAIP